MINYFLSGPAVKGFLHSTKSIRLFFVFTLWGVLAGSMAFAQSSLVIDSVSVNDQDRVVIGWTLQTASTQGYIELHRQLPAGLYGPIMQIPLNQSQYVDNDADARLQSWSYYVVARHPNGDNIAVSNEAHGTLFQRNPAFSICERVIALSWQNYRVTTSAGVPQPLPVPFQKNEVWVSHNGGGEYRATSIPFEQEQFIYFPQEEGAYCFTIRTVNPENQTRSSSAIRCVDVGFSPVAQNPEFTRLSVSELSTGVFGVLEGGMPADHFYGVFLRYDPPQDAYLPLDTLSFSGGNMVFAEENPLVNQRSEMYKIHVLDSCRVFAYSLGPVSTLFAQADILDEGVYNIRWNAYEGWHGGPAGYLVYRITDNEVYDDIFFVDGNTHSFTDYFKAPDAEHSQQKLQYFVIAAEQFDDNFMLLNDAWVQSNTIIIQRTAEVFIPNAFRPNSQNSANRVFMPRFVNYSPAQYRMQIFNRWGEMIFYANDPLQGWDGCAGGQQVPAGVYSYVISYTDTDGVNHRMAGTMMLVR